MKVRLETQTLKAVMTWYVTPPEMYLTSVHDAGFSTGLHPDHSHHHVLCCHIHGRHSQHGYLVLLDKGKQRPGFNGIWKKITAATLLIVHKHVLHFQLYKIRPKRTRPQALLFLCMILLLIVLHTSYMIYSLAPQYVMYGSQKYLVQVRKRVDLWVFPGFRLTGRSQMWGRGSVDGAVVKSVGSNHFGPVGYRQQGGLYGLVAGLLDSCPFWILSVSIRPCGYCCVDLLFDSLPSVWSDVALLFLTLSVWVCAPSCLCFVSKNLWNRIIKMNRSVVFAETCSFKWEKITFKKKRKTAPYDSQGKQGSFPSPSTYTMWMHCF